MADIETRVQRAIEEITGNEALLEMLETDAAQEMLKWGSAMVTSIVKQSEGMDDPAADQMLLPRLKALRQAMRSIGNWAAGKYTDPASRVQLRDQLLAYFASIFGSKAKLPTAQELDSVLNDVDDKNNTPVQLIGKLKALLPESI